jgi:hypothetical protein
MNGQSRHARQPDHHGIPATGRNPQTRADIRNVEVLGNRQGLETSESAEPSTIGQGMHEYGFFSR